MKRLAGLVMVGFLIVGAEASAFASHGEHDHVSFGSTITVDEGETAGDIVCAFCNVRVNGDVAGDMVTFFGHVEVGEGRSISGDEVVFGGHLVLKKDAELRKDLVLFGGDLEQDPSASVRGDRVVFAGGGWLLVCLLPLLLPICFIWFVVWLVRRGRYRVPAYPGGRY